MADSHSGSPNASDQVSSMSSTRTQVARVAMRVDATALRTTLDQLDKAALRQSVLQLRSSPRYAFRNDALTLEVQRPGQTPSAIAAAGRNLSRSGAAFIVHPFLYADTALVAEIPDRTGAAHQLVANVIRCRYLTGSSGLHEVGVRFTAPIDVSQFIADAIPQRLLVVDADPATHNLIDAMFAKSNVELTCAASAVDAACAALTWSFDLILIDLDNLALDAFTVTEELRRGGYFGPIVGVSVDRDSELSRRCAAVGMTGHLVKPITKPTIVAMLESGRRESINSTLASTPAAAELVNAFVGTLRGRAQELAAAIRSGDFAAIHELARELRASGGSYGFPKISEEATRVQALAALGSDPDAIRAAANDLIAVCVSANPMP